ncbi:caspase recruitment domain-containing protein 6 [Ochotona princeps]|uniref:caspase recruitment domain-containing protein 6 n=1 Tax=Ochotona princeps TaxID=9978 RepID=UPI0027147AF5|nr:caspase recruitment domain-containing protein 6 [Ochotona princeps]
MGATATKSVPSEIVEKELLRHDPDSNSDMLASRGLTPQESETLEDVTDPRRRSGERFLWVQEEGAVSWEPLPQCLYSTFPGSAAVQCLSCECLTHGDNATCQPLWVSQNPEDEPGNPETTCSFEEKKLLDLETSGLFRNQKTACKEPVLRSRENKKEHSTVKVSLPNSVEKVVHQVPAMITYLRDGERYEEPDDSLYLGEEDYQEIAGMPADAEATVTESSVDDPGHMVHDSEGHSEEFDAAEFSGGEHSCEDSETSICLEEEEKSLEERKRVFKDVLSHLNMDRSRKLLPESVHQFSLDRGYRWNPETAGGLAWEFLMKVQALDVTARDLVLRHTLVDEENQEESPTGVQKLETPGTQTINPLDVICACMLCAGSSLQREIMSNMYQCQFALPLLLPDAENNRNMLMLGAMKDIVKNRSTESSGSPTGDTETSLAGMKMPVISFVRLGHCSFSKSRILNTLLSPAELEPQNVFLHQDLAVLVLPRQISDGLVEITWCFSDNIHLMENSSVFQKPVAIANLRGDLESFWTQFSFLMEISSALFFFTDCLGEKERNLLMFLGETSMKRCCYFVLSPQAKESEEAQIFQRLLKLNPSQLLFWEGEEHADRRENMKGLQAALQEVMSSSLKCVSVEDMASLARELGIHVDQDFEIDQRNQVSSSKHMAGIAEGDGLQSLSETQDKMLHREPGARHEMSQNAQSYHHTPVFMSPGGNSQALLTRTGDNSNQVSLKVPMIVSPHLGSEQRSKWFCSFSLQDTRAHAQGVSLGTQCFQPQIFHSEARLMNFSRRAQGNPSDGILGRPPIPILPSVWALPQRTQTVGAGALVSQVGHSNSLGFQLAGAGRKPQPGQACAQGTQLTKTADTYRRITSDNKEPHIFQPAGTKPLPQRSAQLTIQGCPSNPALSTGSYSITENKLLPSSQSKSHQPMPSQGVQLFQSKSSSPVLFQTKPQPSHAGPAPPKATQHKPHQAHPSQDKPPQPRFRHSQPNSSQTSSSKSKANHSRARPKRAGRH